jgi:hypothetical protein
MGGVFDTIMPKKQSKQVKDIEEDVVVDHLGYDYEDDAATGEARTSEEALDEIC